MLLGQGINTRTTRWYGGQLRQRFGDFAHLWLFWHSRGYKVMRRTTEVQCANCIHGAGHTGRVILLKGSVQPEGDHGSEL